MLADLPLLHPIPPAWARRNSERIAQLRPEARGVAQAHVDRCWAEGLPVVLMPPVRTDADCAALYAQGRKLIRGVWHVVDKSLVVTNAQTAEDTPHGIHWRAAYDIALLVDGQLVSPKLGPCNDSWDGDFDRAGAIAEGVGLEWGGRWRTKAFPKGDKPHYQLPRWRDLPRLP